MGSRFGSFALRALFTLVVASCVLSSSRITVAQDGVSARRELSTSGDFRLRVSAALYLGRAHPQGARQALETALSDSNAAVRTAAAAALGLLADAHSVRPLEDALGREASTSARIELRRTIDALKAGSHAHDTRYVVQIGSMRNNTRVRGEQLGSHLRSVATAHAGTVPGVVIADSASAARIARERQVPLLVLDGTLVNLTQGKADGSVTFRAQVQLSLRRDQSLKASLTGAATSSDSLQALSDQGRMFALQDEAVAGAVESAMRGAGEGFEIAAK